MFFLLGLKAHAYLLLVPPHLIFIAQDTGLLQSMGFCFFLILRLCLSAIAPLAFSSHHILLTPVGAEERIECILAEVTALVLYGRQL